MGDKESSYYWLCTIELYEGERGRGSQGEKNGIQSSNNKNIVNSTDFFFIDCLTISMEFYGKVE